MYIIHHVLYSHISTYINNTHPQNTRTNIYRNIFKPCIFIYIYIYRYNFYIYKSITDIYGFHSTTGKVKHLERESHKRERSMARAAARAGGGELGVLTADGSVLAMREAGGPTGGFKPFNKGRSRYVVTNLLTIIKRQTSNITLIYIYIYIYIYLSKEV